MITKETQKTLEAIMGEKLTFDGLILAIRQGEELSQVAFAKKLKTSRQILCDIEHRRRTVSLKKAAEYADLLGYSKKQFVRLCLQEMIDKEGLNLVIDL